MWSANDKRKIRRVHTTDLCLYMYMGLRSTLEITIALPKHVMAEGGLKKLKKREREREREISKEEFLEVGGTRKSLSVCLSP